MWPPALFNASGTKKCFSGISDRTLCVRTSSLTSGHLQRDHLVLVMTFIESRFGASTVPDWLVSCWILPVKEPCLVPGIKGGNGENEDGPEKSRKAHQCLPRAAGVGRALQCDRREDHTCPVLEQRAGQSPEGPWSGESPVSS